MRENRRQTPGRIAAEPRVNQAELLIQLLPDGQARWRAGLLLRSGPLAEAAALARNRRVVLLVPSEAVLLARAELPSRNAAEIARALPYALEDLLLQAPETQHYAWTRQQGGIVALVAAQTQMQAWLTQCAEAGIAPDWIGPDLLALPWQPGQWTLLLEGERALLRSDACAGFACAHDLLPALLQAAWDAADETQRPATLLLLHAADVPPVLPELLVPIETRRIETGAWPQPPPPLPNLRSGSYAGRRRGRGAWRALAAAALLALLAALALNITRYVVLGREQLALQSGMDAVFRHVLPQQTRIVDARAQLAAALDEAERKAGGAGSLGLLAQVAIPLTALPGTRLSSLKYDAGALQMSLRLPPPADYAALRARLQALGLQADLTPPAAAAGEAQLRVRAGAAP